MRLEYSIRESSRIPKTLVEFELADSPDITNLVFIGDRTVGRTERRTLLESRLREWIKLGKNMATVSDPYRMFQDSEALYRSLRNIIERNDLPFVAWWHPVVSKRRVYVFHRDATNINMWDTPDPDNKTYRKSFLRYHMRLRQAQQYVANMPK